MRRDFFISHSSKDRRAVEKLCALLRDLEATYWVSYRDIPAGGEHSQLIPRAIRNSRRVLVVFTGAADRSRHIRRELVLADDDEKTIVAVRLKANEEPRALKYFLKTAQWIDLHGSQRTASAERLRSLIGRLRRLRTPAAEETAARIVPADAAGGARAPVRATPAKSVAPAPRARRPALPDDPDRAYHRFTERSAAEKSDAADRMWARGVACCTRKAPDYLLAQRWFERAGKLEKRDFREARRLFAAGARSGNVDAMLALAAYEEAGIGGEPDFKAAKSWLEKGADTRNAEAMCRLGVLLARGLPPRVSPNYQTAEIWTRRAADKGHVEAMYQMGVLFERRRDKQNARRWYGMAAARGHASARYRLR